MDEQPQDAAGKSPKAFRNMTAWIGGATGVIIALGGLATAYRGLIHDKPAEAAATTNGETAQDAQRPADAAAQNVAAAPAGADEEPWYYTADDGGSLRWKDGRWMESRPDGTETDYDHMSSGDGTTVAVKSGGGPEGVDLYLRWRTAGGQAQTSTDRKSWTDVYTVKPDEQQPTG